jgi:hypothetical protein
MKKLLLLIMFLILASCGGSPSGLKNNSQEGSTETLVVDGSNIQGIYRADFLTLNGHVNGSIPGGVTLKRDGDKLYAYSRIFAGGAQVWHQQHVYTGTRCPNLSDDTNLDGYIDINEANAVLGSIIMPLDSDIGSQMAGKRFFPLADLSGGYSYERITSFERFFNDLKGPDKDPTDNMIKINDNEGFSFVGKAVMVQGTAVTIQYPETVGTNGRYKVYQTLPIVCGIFVANNSVPGTILTDEIPGPLGPVIEGQDTPAPAGAGEYYPDYTGTSGSGNNRSGEGENTGEETPDP